MPNKSKRGLSAIPLSLSTIVILFSMLLVSNVYAGVAVVINASVEGSELTKQQAANLFLGKTNTLPSGVKVIPLDQEDGEEAREAFYLYIVKKDASQLNAYWSRLIFTGKGQPPKAVLDDDEVLELIAANPSVIGYISDDAVDDTVKVLLSVK